ncbi:MAG TPA: LURP-one-related family protein, partial [Thermoanaerobaculia bacterium]
MARYKMRQRLLSIGEDYTIEDERGEPVYKVDGKVLRIRETFVIEDRQGNEVATIREKKLALRDSMKILRGGDTIATIRKAWISPFRDKLAVDVEGGEDLVVQ